MTNLDELLEDRPAEGGFRVHRRAFLDPEVFDLEVRHVFEGTWVFLGLESQVAKPNDFFTATIGRQPVIVQRDEQGKVGVFHNSCRHRGALVVPERSGNRARHVCRYHGWTYDSAGRCTLITHEQDGRYPPDFASRDHGLARVPRVASYRGLIFASLNPDVPTLEEHLGEARASIDLVADQSPQGLEFLSGTIRYTFDGNWKLQFENGLDFYHFAVTHASYVEVARHRQAKHGAEAPVRWSEAEPNDQGTAWFERGHALMWSNRNSLRVTRPLQHDPSALAALEKRVGPVRAKWMQLNRNLTIFPNMQLIDVSSLQLRIWRPVSVNRTEMVSWCLAPIGEPPEARRRRIRQYEDFFNPTGLATSDDNVMYEFQQAGLAAEGAGATEGYLRGIAAPGQGPDPHTGELGMKPSGWISGPFSMGSETCFHAGYREWLRLLKAGVAQG